MIRFGSDARQRILGGIGIASAAARTTMGPMGRRVAVDRNYGTLLVRDGVSVVRALEPDDPFTNIGVSLARDVAVTTSDLVGDGTTAAVLMLDTLCTMGARAVAAGLNPVDVCSGMDRAAVEVLDRLVEVADRDVCRKTLGAVAAVALNGERECAELVAEAILEAGDTGSITIVPGLRSHTVLNRREGFRVGTRALTARREIEARDAFVLVHADPIESIEALEAILVRAAAESRKLVVFTCEATEPVLQALARNLRRGAVDVTVLKVTAREDVRFDILGDIAAVTGAMLVGRAGATSLARAGSSALGSVSRVTVTAEETLLVGGVGDGEAIAARRRGLLSQIAASGSERAANQLRSRLADLAGKAVTIEAGGHTELEAKERRDRIDCAVRASKSALVGGVVPGGGAALARLAAGLKVLECPSRDEMFGVEAVRQALTAPMRQMLRNARIEPNLIVAAVEAGESPGFDIVDGEHADLARQGILDPAGVLAVAFGNAASAARSLLLCEVAVAAA